jgi:PKD repeat protein
MVHRYFENGTVIYNGYQVFYPVILIADFSYTVFVGLVNFTDTSVAVYGILNWTWTFGDGGSAYSQHPAHDYSVTGIYTVILYIYDHNGNMAFMPRSVNITVPVAPPTPLAILIADFTYIVVVGHINFTDVSISNKGIINWTWTFGDGGSAYSQHPAHDYAASNNFTVVLRIVDNDTNTAVRPQTVSISLPITPTLPPMVLTVIFSYFGNDGLLHFSDESVSSVGISNWSWSFGDGGFSFDVNPSHNYSLSGVYPVTLIIIDSNGNMQSLTRNVVVSVPFDLFRTISLLPPIFFFAIAMTLTGLMGRVLAKRIKSKKGSRYATLIFVIGITAVVISLLTGGFALW